MRSADRRVVHNSRFRVLGAVSLLIVAGFVVLTWIVLASPGRSLDHPGGFTSGGRVLTVAGCGLVIVACSAMGVGALRVALIIDENRLVIRNPLRTTIVGWESRPRFEMRDRRQEVNTFSSNSSGPWVHGQITYRYSEIVCTVGRERIWIAATSKMRHRDRVEQLLTELRAASGRFARNAGAI